MENKYDYFKVALKGYLNNILVLIKKIIDV